MAMTGGFRVVEDGVESAGLDRPPQRPSWLWLSIGFVIGFGFAIVFFTAGSQAPKEAPDGVTFPNEETPEAVGPEPTPTTVIVPAGIGEVVPGFPDTLVAVTQGEGGGMGLLTWPVSGPPISAPLPGFATESVRFDSSGRMLPMASDITGSGQMLLSAGNPLRIRPLPPDVSGYAWHDSRPGMLAYTQITDAEWSLSVIGSSSTPELVTRGIGIKGRVAAWGDWGFALEADDEITLLAPGGQLEARVDGRVLDFGPVGWIVVASDEVLKLVSAGGGVKQLGVELGLIGDVQAARMSPDGAKVAVVDGEQDHLIVSLDGGDRPIRSPVRAAFSQMTWTSDSRFVVLPSTRGILVIDAQRGGRSETVLPNHTVIAVVTIPTAER